MKKRELTEKERESLKTFQNLKTNYPTFYKWLKTIAYVASAIPFVIWLIYFGGENIMGIPTDIKAGEVLGFYGSLLAFIGTVSLGALALWQNNRIKAENDKAQNKNMAVEHMPVFIFGDIQYTYYNEDPLEPDAINNSKIPATKFNGNMMIWETFSSQNKKTLQLRLHFENKGDALAANIYVERAIDKDRKHCNVLDKEENPTNYILNNQQGIILVNISLENLLPKMDIEYTVNFCNPFGSQYSQSIIIKKWNSASMIEIVTLVQVKIKETNSND